ncbi:MAG: FKBP-type peptidyl-prolyl cis-trans isomerase [Bacteroidia bacterium]|nr:FKBP-type peptidyl-prolyl cis-trans isomerase [Bacteroidia bacterium]
MKNLFYLTLIALTFSACNEAPSFDGASEPVLTNTLDSASYMLGIEYGSWLRSMGPEDINYQLFANAVKTSLTEDSVYLDEMTRGMFLRTYFQDFAAKKQEEMEKEFAPQKEEAMAWLSDVKLQEGVVELEPGLLYKVITEGNGPKPADGDQVTVLYEGRFKDGKVFDTTAGGEPRTFGVNNVIPGWTKALKAMAKGSKWQVWISPDLAYGVDPDPRSGITPNSALMFDVELVDIATPTAP